MELCGERLSDVLDTDTNIRERGNHTLTSCFGAYACNILIRPATSVQSARLPLSERHSTDSDSRVEETLAPYTTKRKTTDRPHTKPGYQCQVPGLYSGSIVHSDPSSWPESTIQIVSPQVMLPSSSSQRSTYRKHMAPHTIVRKTRRLLEILYRTQDQMQFQTTRRF